MSKRKSSVASDWRTTVFFWRGALTLSGEGELVWVGAWVGSAGPGEPTADEFAASDNVFRLTAKTQLEVLSVESLQGQTWSFIGTYKLDQGGGGGLETFSDLEHSFAVGTLHGVTNARFFVVGACGNTEFGRFISHGRLFQSAPATAPAPASAPVPAGQVSGEGCEVEGKCKIESGAGTASPKFELLLARRYVRDVDPRAAIADPVAALNAALTAAAPGADGDAGAGTGAASVAPSRTLDVDSALPWRVSAAKKPR